MRKGSKEKQPRVHGWSRKHPTLGSKALHSCPASSHGSPETQEVAPSMLSSPKLITTVLHQMQSAVFSKHPFLIKVDAACTSRQLGMWREATARRGYVSSDGIPNQSCLKPRSLVLSTCHQWRLPWFEPDE